MNRKIVIVLGALSISFVIAYKLKTSDTIESQTDVKKIESTNSVLASSSSPKTIFRESLGKPPTEHFVVLPSTESVAKLKSYDDDWCFANELTDSAGTRADEEYYKWSAERNHNVGDRKQLLNTYNDYGLEALKNLGEQGDLVALAAIVLNSDNNIELKDWAARSAAIYGGTGDALQHTPSTLKAKAASLLFRGMHKKAKDTFLEGMAWDEFMVLRGDTTLLEITPFLLSQEAYKDLEITKIDEEWISNRAKEIYSEISQERLNLGLDGFDNSVPKSVRIENLAVAAYSKNTYGAKSYHMKYFPENECLKRRIALTAKD